MTAINYNPSFIPSLNKSELFKHSLINIAAFCYNY